MKENNSEFLEYLKISEKKVGGLQSNKLISEKDTVLQNTTVSLYRDHVFPIPIDKEINLDPTKMIISKTDTRGYIEYANEYFMEICGYEEYELMGQPHNIIRHPDMPKTIFRLMWESLKKGENIHVFVKNMAKDGRYYWVLTNFEMGVDQEGNIVSYYAKRKAAPQNAIAEINRLYNIIKAIEKKQGEEMALNYLYGLLEEKKMTYNQFILSILGVNQSELTQYFYHQKFVEQTVEERKKTLIERLFRK